MIQKAVCFSPFLNMKSLVPKCTILIATFNGEKWLSEQLDSIQAQQEVDIRIVVSDDQSTDNTLKILEKHSAHLPMAILPHQENRFGSANKNFLRLMRDADIGESDYIAFADQDDIWRPMKLSRAILKLQVDLADAYSSDVEAFWLNGRTKIVRKSYSMKKFDHIFEAPGPGCTFVLKRSLFINLRQWVISNFIDLSKLLAHDWIIYAFARTNGYSWVIDNVPLTRYRQHHANEIGVNYGLKAIFKRLMMIQNGRYRDYVLVLSELTKSYPECSQALRRLNWRDRLWLIGHASEFRRCYRDVLVLQMIFLLMPK